MAMQLKTGADLNNMPLSRFVIENLIADPTNNIKAGSKYFNTGTGTLANRERIYAGGKWRSTAYMDDIDALQKQLDELDFAGSEEFQSLSGRVLTIEGLFNNGKAKDAEKLGGQLPSYYAEAEIVERLREDFDDLYKTLNDDTTGVINTWQEVVDFVNEYSGSEDLSTILAAMNADIAKRALQSEVDAAFATVNGNVSSIGTKVGSLETLTGNHTNQIADRYTKDESDGRYLKLTGGDISGTLGIGGRLTVKSLIRFNQYAENKEYLLGMTNEGGVLRWYNGTQWNTLLHASNYSDFVTTLNNQLTVPSIKIGGIVLDVVDGNLRISGNAYATGELGSGQVAGEGGGSSTGGGYTAFDDSVTWADYDDSMADWLLTAYHGKLFNDRIATLENKATKVEVSNLLTSGTKIATIKVDANSYDILAPSTDWSAITNKPTTIDGYGITDAIVYNKNGIDISGDSIPLNHIGYGYKTAGWPRNDVAMSIGYSQSYWAQLQFGNAQMSFRTNVNGTISDWCNVLTNNNYELELNKTYLRLIGGTINGSLIISGDYPVITFTQDGVRGGGIGTIDGKLFYYNATLTSSYAILHANNVGEYAFAVNKNVAYTKTHLSSILLGYVSEETDGVTGDFCLLNLPTWTANSESKYYATQIKFGTSLSMYNGLMVRTVTESTNGDWRTLIDTVNYAYFLGNTYLKTDGSNSLSGPVKLAHITELNRTTEGLYVGKSDIAGGAPFDYASFFNVTDKNSSSLQIAWDRSANVPKYAVRLYDGKSFSNWCELIHDGNIGNFALKIDGSNKMTGGLNLLVKSSGGINVNPTEGLFVYGGPSSGGVSEGFPSDYINAFNIGGTGITSNAQLAWYRSKTQVKLYARVGETSGYGDWKTIAFTDSDITGNAATATKLQNTVYLWGNAFDGSSSINSNMFLANGTSLFFADSNGKYINACTLSPRNDLMFGYGTANDTSAYSTYLDGNNIFLRCGQSKTVAMSISSIGNIITFNGSIIANGDSVVFKNGSVVYWRDTSNTNKNILTYNRGKLLAIGYGIAEAGNITGLYGNTIKLFAGESRSLAMTITANGRFLLGSSQIDGGATVNISGRIHVNGATANIALGANPSAGISTGEANGYGTTIWASSNGQGNIQSMRYDGSTTSYALNLNPLGGVVNIASADATTNVLGLLKVTSRVFIGDVVDDGSSALQLYGDISAHSTNINFKSTGSWAKGLYALDPNGNRLGGIGFYVNTDVLNKIWIGHFENPWIAIKSTEANFNILTKFNSSVKIGEATLSYEDGALKVDKNFFAEGEVASGKVAEEGTGGNTPSGSGLEIKTFDIASTTENEMVELAHNLGTRDVVVQIFENSQSSNYQQVFADVYYVDTAKVAINFGAAQTVPHRVIIMG